MVDAGVVGAHDREGVVRVAAVLAAPSASADLGERAGRRCAAALAPHECPRTILILDELPVTASGKMDRGALRRLVDAATGAGAAR